MLLPCFVASTCLAVPSSAVEFDQSKYTEMFELISEVAPQYSNAKNISYYLADTESPIDALQKIAKSGRGKYSSELIKQFVSYETATGSRNLANDRDFAKYLDSGLMAKFADFYGFYGGNSENSDEPFTADSALDTVNEYLPGYFEENPTISSSIMEKQSIEYDYQEISDLSKDTGLSQGTVKVLLQGMASGIVIAPAIVQDSAKAEADVQAFVEENFAAEIAQAKRIQERSDSYMAAYEADMEKYQEFISSMESEAFSSQFQNYSKFFTADQKEQALQPYVNQAQQLLERAKQNYQLGLNELVKLKNYLDNFESRKLEPALERYNKSILEGASLSPDSHMQIPKFSSAGIFSFAVTALEQATGGSTISTSSATNAISSAIGSNVSSSLGGSGSGFEVSAPDFGSLSSGALTNVGGDVVGNTTSTLSDSVTSINSFDSLSAAKTNVTSSLTSSFNSGQNSKSEDASPLPTNALTRYWRVTDSVVGDSFKPLCDGSDKAKTGSAGRITRSSPAECNDRLHRLTASGAKTNDMFSLVSPEGGTEQSASGSQVAVKTESASKGSMASLYESSSAKTSTFIKNRKGDNVVLTRKQASGAQALQEAGLKESGYDLSSNTREARVVNNGGSEEYNNFNPSFSNDSSAATKEAISQGYCLMIEDPNGAYNVSLNSSYNPTYDPQFDPDFDSSKEKRHIKYNMGSGKSASIVRITHPEHPFSPRHKLEWVDAPDPLSSVCGGASASTSGADGFSTAGFASDGFGNTITNAGAIASGVGSLSGGVGSVLGGVGSITQGLTGVAGQVSGALGSAISGVASATQGVVGSVQNTVNGVVDGVKGSAVVQSAQNTISGAKATATGVVSSAKESIGAVVNGDGTISKSGAVIGSVAGSVEGAVGGVVNSSGEIVSSAGEVVGNVVGGVNGVTQPIIGGVVNSVGQIKNSAGEVVGNIAGGVSGAASSLVGGVVSSSGQILNSAGQVVGNVAGAVGGAIGVVTGGVGALTAVAKAKAMEVAQQQAKQAIVANAGSAVGGAVANIVSISKTCGTDKKKWLGNVYAWERAYKVGGKNYSYYKKPIVDHGGKILTTPDRLAKYSAIGFSAYSSCMAGTFGLGQGFCCDVAEHSACQAAILPGVTMDNKLPLSYTKAHAVDDDDKKLPHITTNAYDSTQIGGFDNNGYNWKTSLPADKFGFNGPWVKSTVTGDVGFGEIDGMSKKKYAQYMLTIAGVNSGYSMSENNNSSTLAKNMSCGTGGWEELKRYQENCARFAGVNCICDYQKAMFKGTSWAYVLDRVSAFGLNIDNKSSSKVVTTKIDGKEYSRSEDTTERLNWKRKILASVDGTPYHAQANYPLGGDDSLSYPGKGTKSLNNAKVGSVIVMQEAVGNELTDPDSAVGLFKRPWMAAFVESKNPQTGCLTVTTKNAHSIFLDACGNSENLGHETRFEICPPNSKSSTFSISGGMPDCASNHEYYSCQESASGWNSWTVHNFYEDVDTGFNETTGALVDNSNCATYHAKIKTLIDEMNGSQGSLDKTAEVKAAVAEAQSKSCPPDPTWGVAAGALPSIAKSDSTQANYVPSSSSEEGVPMNFDFIGFFGSLLDKLTGGGDIFPKIKDAAGV